MVRLAGYNLIENSSGENKSGTSISKRGRKNLRCVLYQISLTMVATNPEMRQLYNYLKTRKENPLKKKQSVVALSCKLIRIFYAILVKGVEYDGEKMLSDIHRNQAA